jgi:hypothetical protein
MHAGTSAAWWSMTQRFARTAAVGSMLGSLIGKNLSLTGI